MKRIVLPARSYGWSSWARGGRRGVISTLPRRPITFAIFALSLLPSGRNGLGTGFQHTALQDAEKELEAADDKILETFEANGPRHQPPESERIEWEQRIQEYTQQQLEERQLLGARALGGLRARVDVDRREAHLSRVGRRVLRGEW